MRTPVLGTRWSSLLAMSMLLVCSLGLFAKDNSSPAPVVRGVVSFGVSAPVRELAKLPAPPQYAFHSSRLVRTKQRGPAGTVVDAVEQSTAASGSNFSINVSVPGVGLGFSKFSAVTSYPDTNIAVGDNQIVQSVNLAFAVFDKTGTALTSAMATNSLWAGIGGACYTNNNGDAIAEWDVAAHRWVLAQNVLTGPPYYACVAVSTSADATGTYYLYQFSLGNGYPDSPKWGIWSNAYYQSQDNFGNLSTYIGAEPCAYNRTKMLAGDNSAEQICFQLSDNDFALKPADIDSAVGPPANEDEFLFSLWDSSDFSLYSIHVDFATLQGSITGNNGSQLFVVPAFNPACNGEYYGTCVPQLGVPDQLLVLGDRLLYRLVYDNDMPLANVLATPPFPAPAQHWFVVHDVTASGGNQAERWYEFIAKQKATPVTNISLLQSGTFAPDSTVNRWMGSIARDKKNDIMMGYSESNATMYPSIAITGRLLSDTKGTMENELVVENGLGSHTGDSLWGEYTTMRLDPSDGCTLWYTNQYYTATGLLNWSTRINSATFAGCN
jgi:hypothetical protein